MIAGRSLSGWPTRYTLIGFCFAASFICYIDRVNISVAAIAMAADFGWSETHKGFVLSAFFIGYMSTQVLGGWLANRFGGKIVLGLAVTLWSIFSILTPFAAFASLGLLIGARIALGMGEGVAHPACYNLFIRWVPLAERSRTIALYQSGIPLGTLFALMTTGWIVTRWGWPSVFYVFGSLGLAWAAGFFHLTSNDPDKHPRIRSEERALLRDLGHTPQPTRDVPWRQLFSKAPVWALIFNHFCSAWALYTLLAWLPSYFSTVHGVNITSAGIYSAAPWLTMFVMMNVSGWCADALKRGGMRLTSVRKLMQSVGLLGPALFLLLLRDVHLPSHAVILTCCALGTLAFTAAGFASNHFDIAPRYADVLMGITNTFGTIPGIIGVAITGWLVDLTHGYAASFLLNAGVNVLGAAVWLAFASGEQVVD